jgi:hypothetical protein
MHKFLTFFGDLVRYKGEVLCPLSRDAKTKIDFFPCDYMRTMHIRDGWVD